MSATLVVALVLISGCGGSSSSEKTAKFKTSYESIRNELKQSSTAIGSAIQHASSQTDAQVLTSFRALAKRWQGQLSQLEILKPPAKVAADFNTLTSAATRVESDLTAIVAAAATHSKAAAEQGGASIVTDVVAARSADATITQKLAIK